VERRAKFGSHLASTGKSELKVAQYDMASNGFKGEAPTEIREKDLEDTTSKKKRTRGDIRGLPKLKDIEANVRSIEKRLVGVAWRKLGGAIQFGEVRKQFVMQWTDKSTTFLTPRSENKKNSIIAHPAGNQNASMNQWEREKGWDKQPRILGMVAFSDLRTDPHRNDIILEIRARKPHLYVDSDDNNTQLKKQLQQIVIDEIKDADQTLKESEVKEKAKYFKPKSSAGFEPVELENPQE
jgi:hypothetical protein